MMMCGQIGVDLWLCVIYYDKVNIEVMQQFDIVNDVGKIVMFNGFVVEYNDKGFFVMGVDIGN